MHPARPAPQSGLRPSPATDWRLKLPGNRRRHLRLWFYSGAALTFLIVIVGGITRLTQSGLSIVHWQPIMGVVPPLSEAQWQEAFARYREFPEYQLLRRGMTMGEFQFIFFWEYLHRMVARLIGLVFLIPALFFWARGYFHRPLGWWVLGLFALGGLQGFMGWYMVASGLVDRPSVSHYRLAAHLSLALVIFGVCLWLARELKVRPARSTARDTTGTGVVYALGGLLLLQILWGVFVAGLKAGLIFNTFPLMGEGLVPPGAWQLEPVLRNLVENPATVQWLHRVLGTVLALVAVGGYLLHLRPGVDPTSRRLSAAFLTLMLVQYTLGVLTLLLRVPVSLGVLHQAVAVVIFGLWLIWLHHVLAPRQGEAPVPMTTGTQRAGLRAAERQNLGALRLRLSDYVTLTKPRIISLLLVTTLIPMAVAAGGWPGWELVFWAMLGGYLMAGGANAINMYLDRDIDAHMGRTALRPIPSGRMSPGHGLGFGITLGVAAFLVFALLINLPSAVLALAGLLYYVLVYTRWLKRTTPQNIVIGGAAGAFPPLVGWAAVTGDISLTAIFFFLIVFLWTPPHFWALALVKQKDYGRVGVPMAPNVWGEQRTLRQMLGYTVALLVLTLAPVAVGSLGLVYGALALLLGGWFLRDLLLLMRATCRVQPAWAVYRTSLLYLALLFGAMAADVAVGSPGWGTTVTAAAPAQVLP